MKIITQLQYMHLIRHSADLYLELHICDLINLAIIFTWFSFWLINYLVELYL
jgi:hypothetical protein